MPKSKVRKKAAYTAPPVDKRTPEVVRATSPTGPIYLGVMLGLMVLGLIWLVVNYLVGEDLEFFRALGAWNFAIGFALIVGGLLMTMRWR